MALTTILIPNRIACAAVLFASLGLAVPAAAADDGQQIAIYGKVAPRCWVAEPARQTAQASQAPAQGQAICNHARPVLVSQVRMIGADGGLVSRVSADGDSLAAPAPISTRAAIEIVVSPQP